MQTPGGGDECDHTEGEKQKENALRIGRDALLEADLEYIDRPY